MIVFVSYARQDNNIEDLRRIERQVAIFGQAYVDDLHDHGRRNRQEIVEYALWAAGLFVAVFSPNYLKTVWTRKEFELAVRRGTPLLTLKKHSFIAPPSQHWSLEIEIFTRTDSIGLSGTVDKRAQAGWECPGVPRLRPVDGREDRLLRSHSSVSGCPSTDR